MEGMKTLAKRTAKWCCWWWFCLWYTLCHWNDSQDHQHLTAFVILEMFLMCPYLRSKLCLKLLLPVLLVNLHWTWSTLRIYHENCHEHLLVVYLVVRFMRRALKSGVYHCVALLWSIASSVFLVILFLSLKVIVTHFLCGVISGSFEFQKCSKFYLKNLLHAKLSIQGGLLVQTCHTNGCKLLTCYCLLASFFKCVKYVVHVCVVAGLWTWFILFVVMEKWVSQLNEIVTWQLFISLQSLGSRIEDILEHQTGQMVPQDFFTITVLLICLGSVICWGCQRMSWGCFIMHAKGCHNNFSQARLLEDDKDSSLDVYRFNSEWAWQDIPVGSTGSLGVVWCLPASVAAIRCAHF